MKLTYAKLLDEIEPSLMEISKIGFPMNVPIAHHIAIAENLESIETSSKAFWTTRDKILTSLCEKDKDGQSIMEEVDGLNGQKVSTLKLSPENKVVWGEKYEELRQTSVEVKLTKLDKKNFEGIADLKPAILKGVLCLLK